MKNTTLQLIKGAIVISAMYNREIASIQFEDGSGYNFNVIFAGDSEPTFVNIPKDEILAKVYQMG